MLSRGSSRLFAGLLALATLSGVTLLELEKQINRNKELEKKLRILEQHHRQLVAEEADSCFPAIRF